MFIHVNAINVCRILALRRNLWLHDTQHMFVFTTVLGILSISCGFLDCHLHTPIMTNLLQSGVCQNSQENGGGYYFKIKVSFANNLNLGSFFPLHTFNMNFWAHKILCWFFSEIYDQPLIPNGFCFSSFSFLSRSKTRAMPAERADRQATHTMQCCDYAMYKATLLC